ncbi:MAG: peptidylprolyl isomerase [Crocinitomicaceae bacterium]|nr:peptidylprolyl isomerase [Crocinitomicaceae bacterium]
MLRSISLIFLLTLSHASLAQGGSVIDKIVAKIGDEYILLSDIQNQKLNMIQNGAEPGSISECDLLENLMYEKLLVNQAVIDSIEVGDEIVNQEMESRLQVIANQIGSIERLEQFYGKSVAQIKAEFFEVIKKRMQAERMKESITEGVDITPREVKEFYNNLHRDSIPYINSKITVAQIVLYPKLTQADKDKALKTITEARERVMSGEMSFSTEAVLTSDDPGSKLEGGDLGWQTRGTMVPEFEAELFRLGKNEISPVFETQYGYHFIEMLDRKGDNYHVRHILVSPKVDKRALVNTKTRIDSIYAAIQKKNITFEDAALRFSDDEQSKNNGGKIINPYSGDYKWDLQNINDIDPQMSRIVERLEIGDYSQPGLYDNYYEQKQGVRIVKLLGKTKPHLANLQDDYQLIQMAALNEKKQEIINEWVKSKVQSNYIWISEEYATKCNFRFEWVKKGS